MGRTDQYNLIVTLDGADLGTWDKMTGGGKDSEETKYRPGNMGPERTLGGHTMVENIVVTRLYELIRDHSAVKTWMNRVGKGAVTITKQPLDVDGNAFGAPLVYTGILKRVTPPEVDSEGTDAALIEMEISTNDTIA